MTNIEYASREPIVNDYEQNIIFLKQEPIITYEKIEAVGKEIERRIAELNLDNLMITADSVKSVRETRADLNKEFDAFEVQRKFIKQAVNKPYDDFLAKYNAFIATNYKTADAMLKAKIVNFEFQLKKDKEDRLRAYFNELCEAKEIDFVHFERVGLSITQSASEKSLKGKILTFIESIRKDLDLLKSIPETDEFKAEVLVDYRKSLNMSMAMKAVQYQRDEKRKQLQRLEEEKRQQAEHQMQQANDQQPNINSPLKAPTLETPQSRSKEQEAKVETAFRVRGTTAQLKALKQFIIENNIEIVK